MVQEGHTVAYESRKLNDLLRMEEDVEQYLRTCLVCQQALSE